MTLTPGVLTRRQALAGVCARLSPTLAMPSRAPAAPVAGRIVASFSLLADMLREIVPPDFEVEPLVPAAADAHVFEPRPADAGRLARADLVVVNGLGFEGWIERLVKSSGYRGVVLVASRDIEPRRAGRGTDPHAWQDPSLVRRYVETLLAALSQRWPARADELRRHAADYDRRLAQLDAAVRQRFAPIPPDRRRVISSHDAFGYFGAAYGIEFLAVQGWNTQAEPSAAQVARLIEQVRRRGAGALFVENISDPRLVQRIASESGARVGGTLYSDALSAPGGPADTYLKLVGHNADAIASALAPGR